MSTGGMTCKVKEHRSLWFVQRGRRRMNASAFNGYRYTPSDYSDVWCPACYTFWRSKAAYVDRLPERDITIEAPKHNPGMFR